MKKSIILIAVTFLFGGFKLSAQDVFPNNIVRELNYEVHGTYKRPIKKSQFTDAKLVRDIISGYPTNWISGYVSVEISGICAGKLLKAKGLTEKLTPEQKHILNTIDLESDMIIHVKYMYSDIGKSKLENGDMHVEMTVIPETEAEFVGGHEQLIKYLKQNSYSKLPAKKQNDFKGAIIKFTINEGGEVINAKCSQKWGDAKTDQLLLDLINHMPNWKPAVNNNGVKVKQDFVFTIGSGGC